MTANISNTSAQSTPSREAGWYWLFLALCSLLLLGVYFSAVNQNYLYLSLLLALFLLIGLGVKGWRSMLLMLFVLAYLSSVVGNFQTLDFVDPLPHEPPGDMVTLPIPSDQSWNYTFKPDDIPSRLAHGHIAAYLCIDGEDLQDLIVELDGQKINTSAYSFTKLHFEHLAIPVVLKPGVTLNVRLQSTVGRSPRVFIGPEVSKSDVFPDAVWLEVTANTERVVYHARRLVSPAR
jgi:hypothetical protein